MKNLANYISISRILMSIVLIFIPVFNIYFWTIYIYCGLSDVLDGFVARKCNIESETGSKIDTIADTVFIFVYFINFLPILNISTEIYIWIIVIAIIKVSSIVKGYFYYKTFIASHTILNKITGVLIFVLPLSMRYININIFKVVICIVATFSAICEGYNIKKSN